MHDKCQWLSPAVTIPEDCKAGHAFPALNATFKVAQAEYPDTDSNHYSLVMEGSEAQPFDCSCFDYGAWFCSDPTDRRKELTCPGAVQLVSTPAAKIAPSQEQQQAACCVMHDKCQWLSPAVTIPEDCKAGHAFPALNATFKVAQAEYPDTDSNHYSLVMEGSEAQPFDCSCFDYGAWFCSDPSNPRRTLECLHASSIQVTQVTAIIV